MKLYKAVFNFYINSSIHVALAVIALVAFTVLRYDLYLPLPVWLFVFFGTITGYNFVKYAAVAGLHHRSLTNALKSIQIFSFFSFGIILLLLFLLSKETIIATVIFALLTFFYAVPLLKNKNLRTLSGLKIFIVALVWAGVTVILPLVASKTVIETAHLLAFLQRLCLVLVLTLPFEIRDIPYDATGLQTFPQQLGIKKTKGLGILLLLIVLLLTFFNEKADIRYVVSMFLVCFLTGILLIKATQNQSRYYASFWVEGIPIMGLVVFLIFRHFLS